MTVAELKTRLRSEAFPEGLAPEQAPAVYSWMREAFIDLQRMAPKCLQVNQVNVYPFASTYWKCGTSVVCLPAGQIKRVYTVGAEFCQPVDYIRWNYQHLRSWSRGFARRSGVPDNTSLPSLQLGLKYPKNSTDHLLGIITNAVWGRSRSGIWSTENNNLIVAPWIQESESIVIEWSGFKPTWSDADIISSGNLNEDTWFNAIATYVLARKAKRYDADYARAQELNEDYDTAISLLSSDCRRIVENIEPTEAVLGDSQNVAISEAIALRESIDAGTTTGSGAATEPQPVIVAAIGDYGLAGDDELAVATLVKSWNPAAVITLGDNNYPDGAADTIDQNVGFYYRRFIYPYKGSQPLWDGETDATTNAFLPCIGNHDLTPGFPPIPYLDYFTLPGIGRFYSFVLGYCEFFCIDSGIKTDGTVVEILDNSAVGFQAMWLQARLAASTAKFRCVYFHHPPFTSDESYWPGFGALRWPFKKWSADLVMSGHGHQYEHVVVDGFNYFVNGSGGAELRGLHDPVVDGSVKTYTEKHGAIKMSILCDSLTIQFYNVDGEKIDEVIIINDNPGMNSGNSQSCACVSTTVYNNSGILPANTLDDARALPNLASNKVLIVGGRVTQGDGGGSMWSWKADSTDPDDGVTVLKPSDTVSGVPGRWWILFA